MVAGSNPAAAAICLRLIWRSGVLSCDPPDCAQG